MQLLSQYFVNTLIFTFLIIPFIYSNVALLSFYLIQCNNNVCKFNFFSFLSIYFCENAPCLKIMISMMMMMMMMMIVIVIVIVVIVIVIVIVIIIITHANPDQCCLIPISLFFSLNSSRLFRRLTQAGGFVC